jgi:hypothetical protein
MEGPFRAADLISDINEAMLKAYTEIWAALAMSPMASIVENEQTAVLRRKRRALSAQSGVI